MVNLGFLVVIFFATAGLAKSESLNEVAYIGDSQTQEGGIGDALTCLRHENIIGFHSASAWTYLHGRPYGKKKCNLPSSYQPVQGDRCDAAKAGFAGILGGITGRKPRPQVPP